MLGQVRAGVGDTETHNFFNVFPGLIPHYDGALGAEERFIIAVCMPRLLKRQVERIKQRITTSPHSSHLPRIAYLYSFHHLPFPCSRLDLLRLPSHHLSYRARALSLSHTNSTWYLLPPPPMRAHPLSSCRPTFTLHYACTDSTRLRMREHKTTLKV